LLQEELSKDFSVVGTVENGEKASLLRLDPDVPVLDNTMLGLDLIQVASHLTKRQLSKRSVDCDPSGF
jgi:hypothetical protein